MALQIEGKVVGMDSRTKDGKTTNFALVVDGMESYKISSVKSFGCALGEDVLFPVRVTDFKGQIYYSIIN
jgi:hypothetical protein